MDDVFDPYELYEEWETSDVEDNSTENLSNTRDKQAPIDPPQHKLDNGTAVSSPQTEEQKEHDPVRNSPVTTKDETNTTDTQPKIEDDALVISDKDTETKEEKKPLSAKARIALRRNIPECMILFNLPPASTHESIKEFVLANADPVVEVISIDGVYRCAALVVLKPASEIDGISENLSQKDFGDRKVVARKLSQRDYFVFLDKKSVIKVKIFNISLTLLEDEVWNILSKKLSTTDLVLNMCKMKHSPRRHDGFGFAYFNTIAEAEEFCLKINQTKIGSTIVTATIKKKCDMLNHQQRAKLNKLNNLHSPVRWRVDVSNVAIDITEDQLGEIFSAEINSAAVAVLKRDPSDPRLSSGFIEFQTEEAANSAVDLLDGCDLSGSEIHLKLNFVPNYANLTNGHGKAEQVRDDRDLSQRPTRGSLLGNYQRTSSDGRSIHERISRGDRDINPRISLHDRGIHQRISRDTLRQSRDPQDQHSRSRSRTRAVFMIENVSIYSDYNEMLSKSRGSCFRIRMCNLSQKVGPIDLIKAVKKYRGKGMESLCILNDRNGFSAIIEFTSSAMAEEISYTMRNSRICGSSIIINADVGSDDTNVGRCDFYASNSNDRERPQDFMGPSAGFVRNQMNIQSFETDKDPRFRMNESLEREAGYQQREVSQFTNHSQFHMNEPPIFDQSSNYQPRAVQQQQLVDPEPAPSSVRHPEDVHALGVSTAFLDTHNIQLPLVKKLLVLNIDFSVSEDDLSELFAVAGTVVQIQYNCVKGQAIVEMNNEVAAVQAISMFHSQDYFEKVITVRMLRANDPDDQVTKKTAPVIASIPRGLKSIGRGFGIEGRPMNIIAPPQSTNSQAAAVPAYELSVWDEVQSNDNPNVNGGSGKITSVYEYNHYQPEKQDDFGKKKSLINFMKNSFDSGACEPKQGRFSTNAHSGGFGSTNNNMRKQDHRYDNNRNYNPAMNNKRKFSRYPGP